MASKENPNLLFSAKAINFIKYKFSILARKKEEEKQNEEKHKEDKKLKGCINGSNLLDLWSILEAPVEYLGEYFGERVALYFMFLYFAIEELIPISFFGIVTFIVQFLYEPDQLPSKMAVIFFTFLIVFWASTFEAIWKKKEVEFQTIFGLEELE